MRDQNSPPPMTNMLNGVITLTLSSWGIKIRKAGHQLRANVQVAANMFRPSRYFLFQSRQGKDLVSWHHICHWLSNFVKRFKKVSEPPTREPATLHFAQGCLSLAVLAQWRGRIIVTMCHCNDVGLPIGTAGHHLRPISAPPWHWSISCWSCAHRARSWSWYLLLYILIYMYLLRRPGRNPLALGCRALWVRYFCVHGRRRNQVFGFERNVLNLCETIWDIWAGMMHW